MPSPHTFSLDDYNNWFKENDLIMILIKKQNRRRNDTLKTFYL